MVLEVLFESIGVSSSLGTIIFVGIILFLIIIVISVMKHKGKAISDTDEERDLKRQVRLERKERRRERKEMKQFLNEDVLGQKLKRSEKKLISFRKDIETYLNRFITLLHSFLHFLGAHTKETHTNSIKKRMSTSTKVIVDYLGAFSTLFESELKVLHQDRELLDTIGEKIGDENKTLTQEKRIILKEYYTLRQSFKKGEHLDQTKKGAILNRRIGLINDLQRINGTLRVRMEKEQAGIESDEHTVHRISDQTHDFYDTLESHKNKKSVPTSLLKNIHEWFVGNSNVILTSMSDNSTLAAFIELVNKTLAAKEEVYRQKRLLDAEYRHFILEEESVQKEAA
ncbi:hypothetical protein COV17_02195 [Candidatus Woesearchaeota archaeon CG10_big_fil_rev_8_21_14_0_10_36_11]|nr:MAG: hypothetical protein COV17_02195 [Candidatus Woesearchaeota archaeon CG10_big_fil_rev_8_21_14_0_10_36_11]